MPHSFQAIYFHIVFATKERAPLILPGWRPKLFAQLARTTSMLGHELLASGGVEDHVHLLASLSRSAAPADYVREIKSSSSQWARRQVPCPEFAWQRGYAVFSVSRSNRDAVLGYIARQEEHHRSQPFEAEFRLLLEKHGVEYDERDLWE